MQLAQFENCKKIFVNYAWLLGILFFLSVPIITIFIRDSQAKTQMKSDIISLQEDVQAIKRIENKVDILIERGN